MSVELPRRIASIEYIAVCLFRRGACPETPRRPGVQACPETPHDKQSRETAPGICVCGDSSKSSTPLRVLSQADLVGHCLDDLFHFGVAQLCKPLDFLGGVYIHSPLRCKRAKPGVIN